MNRKILLVEDDQSFGYILKEYLGLKGYEVVWQKSGEQFESVLQEGDFVLAILDINLPGMDGFELSKVLAGRFPDLPFIFLSARDMKIDQLKGYKLGAAEYVTKPIDEELFLAKIEAILNRTGTASTPDLLQYEDLVLNLQNSTLQVNESTIYLTNRECDLLKELMKAPGHLVERNYLLTKYWSTTDEFARNSMDVFISKLRKYLGATSVEIRNQHGKGFILE